MIGLLLAAAALQADMTEILGVGNHSCGAWSMAAEGRTGARAARSEYIGWLMGFLSGVNSTPAYRELAIADGQAYTAWIDGYCGDHPLDTVYVAAATLVNELIDREG